MSPHRGVPPLIALKDVVQASLRQLTIQTDHKWTFIGQEWVEKTATDTIENSAEEEERKPPMAIVSLSRGGKTRALLELTKELRSRGTVAIYVSFNDSTKLLPWNIDLNAPINRSYHH